MNSHELLTKLLKEIKHIHFVGIGGISMSALADIMLMRGFAVTGSDIDDSTAVRGLRERGVVVHIGHAAGNVGGAELVVYTAAVNGENPELMEAAARGIPVVERSVFMGALMDRFDSPVTVAGTHGKTTTTSMLAHILIAAELDPTVLVGGRLPVIGGTFCIGKSGYIVCEACEYADSFLHFRGKTAVILNIEAEHLDYFGDLDGVLSSFRAFARGTLPGGTVVANADDPNVPRCVEGLMCDVVTYSIKDSGAHYFARVTSSERGLHTFTVYERGQELGNVSMSVAGMHNVANGLAACAAARTLGVRFDAIARGLHDFSGTKRRLDIRGDVRGFTVMDDYAHHPTEIAASIAAARDMGFSRILCMFQPHTYSRTAALLDDFARVLGAADRVALLPIYAARERNTYGISSDDVTARIPGAVSLEDFAQASDWALEHALPGDVVITMGAGDIYKVADMLLK